MAGALPQTPLGELTAFPRPPSCISGVLLLRKRRGKRRKQREEKQKKNKKDGGGKRKRRKETRSQIHVSGYATEKKEGKGRQKWRKQKGQKINGRRGEGKASELGGRLPPGAEGDGRPLITDAP